VAYSLEMLVIGRVIVGCGIGMASNIVLIFVAEISPPEKRGALVTLNNLFITGGQLVSYLVDSAFSSVPEGWRYMLGLAAVPALIQLLGMIFIVPESPRWLISKQQKEEAVTILQKIRGRAQVDTEIQEIEQSIQLDYGVGWRSLLEPRVRSALVLGVGLQVIQQFLGINTAMYYSASIIKMSGVENDETAIWFSDLVAATNAIFTVIAIFLIDKIGRRCLLLSSMIPTILFLYSLGFSFQARRLDILTDSMAGLVALDSLVLYVAFFAVGLGPIPWAVNSEIYPLKIRSKANSIATMMNWIANLVISMSFLSYIDLVTEAGAFWTYGCIGVVSWFFLYFRLPETMGKTMEQMEKEINKDDTHHTEQFGKNRKYVSVPPGETRGEV